MILLRLVCRCRHLAVTRSRPAKINSKLLLVLSQSPLNTRNQALEPLMTLTAKINRSSRSGRLKVIYNICYVTCAK